MDLNDLLPYLIGAPVLVAGAVAAVVVRRRRPGAPTPDERPAPTSDAATPTTAPPAATTDAPGAATPDVATPTATTG